MTTSATATFQLPSYYSTIYYLSSCLLLDSRTSQGFLPPTAVSFYITSLSFEKKEKALYQSEQRHFLKEYRSRDAGI